MPELPEVETVRLALDRTLTGQRIKTVDVRAKGLRKPFSEDLGARLTGRKVLRCSRRAKYALLELDGAEVLVIHLGMSGRVLLHEQHVIYAPEKHDHLVMTFDNGVRFVLNDARRFGMVFLVSRKQLDRHDAFKSLGPEPLAREFTGAVLAQALAGRKTAIKAALLDQRIVAGLGNIYVSEALFDAGISPLRPAGSLSVKETSALCASIKKVLKKAVAAGGSSLKDYKHPDGELGYFQHSFTVYDREGQACRGCNCNIKRTGGIKRLVQGGRSTFFCPRRQI